MKPNIFVYKNYKNEDHFTVSLGYLLNLFPSILGNRLLEKISIMSGNPWDYYGKFLEAEFIGHELQSSNSTSKPDMIIHTTTTKIFFEHKLESSLSRDQLDRHFIDVNQAKGELVFVSNIQTPIPTSIVNRKNYIKPKNQNHFIWSDFESVFNVKLRKGSTDFQLLNDFKQGLRSNGMRGRLINGFKGNLYTNGSDSQNFAFDELKKMLTEIGFKAWRRGPEFTLRVNPEKAGKDPLFNPRFESSGEIHDDLWIEECLLIYCWCNPGESIATRKIHKIKELEISFSNVEFFKVNTGIFGSNKQLIGIIYIPLKFISVGNKHEINWKYLRKIWEKIYEIVQE